MTLRAKAYAKVNRFLSVGPIDARGYHPIRTIFQTIGIADEVVVQRAEADSVTLSDPTIPPVNTVTRALSRLREVVEIPPLSVSLQKNIPSEAGLGGGSSDAATVLRLARLLAPYTVGDDILREVAASIGADVPFFLVGGQAKGKGYGDVLTPLPDEGPEWLVVAKPDVSCSTPEAYAKLDLLNFEWRDFPDGDQTHNDFERVAPCESLDLIERLEALGAKHAHLCGSGSAVFGTFRSHEEAEAAAEQLKDRVWVVPTIDRRTALGFTRDP